MPSKITKRGRVRWMGRVQKDGVIRQRLFDTKQEAQKWEVEERDADWSKTDTGSLTALDWTNRYLDHSQKFSSKTYREKTKAFRELFGAKDSKGKPFVSPSDPADKLTPGQVLAVLQVQFTSRSGYAANKDRKNLVAGWHWGMKYLGLPSPNPCLTEKFPEERQPRYVPPEEDFWAVYEEAEGQDQVLLLTLLHLGARIGELFRLTWSDVDFGRGRVRLGTRKREGGSMEYDWLPMTGELKAKLLWWWENRPFKRSTHVFVCEDTCAFALDYLGEPFTSRQHFMKKLCDKAKVKPFGFHAIRHLTASILFGLGQPVSVIQAILRHKSASTTERYLKTLGLEETRDALESLSLRRPGKVIEMRERPAENRAV